LFYLAFEKKRCKRLKKVSSEVECTKQYFNGSSNLKLVTEKVKFIFELRKISKSPMNNRKWKGKIKFLKTVHEVNVINKNINCYWLLVLVIHVNSLPCFFFSSNTLFKPHYVFIGILYLSTIKYTQQKNRISKL
jgi:hypothetical protein